MAVHRLTALNSYPDERLICRPLRGWPLSKGAGKALPKAFRGTPGERPNFLLLMKFMSSFSLSASVGIASRKPRVIPRNNKMKRSPNA